MYKLVGIHTIPDLKLQVRHLSILWFERSRVCAQSKRIVTVLSQDSIFYLFLKIWAFKLSVQLICEYLLKVFPEDKNKQKLIFLSSTLSIRNTVALELVFHTFPSKKMALWFGDPAAKVESWSLGPWPYPSWFYSQSAALSTDM